MTTDLRAAIEDLRLTITTALPDLHMVGGRRVNDAAERLQGALDRTALLDTAPPAPAPLDVAIAAAALIYRRQHDAECMCEGCIAYDDATDEVEGPSAPPPGTKLVLMSDELFELIAAPQHMNVEWGEPDEHGWYSPTIQALAPSQPESGR